MALRKIVRFPQPLLRQPTREVTAIDKNIRTLVQDMMETMCDVNGAGLAAIQVGALERIFIIEAVAAGCEKTDPPKVFINPVLEMLSPETDVKEEGCLSFPSIFIPVKRSLRATVSALDLEGNKFTIDVEDFYARAIQHEHDHLDGILFTDHLTPLRRRLLQGKLRDITAGRTEAKYKMRFPPAK